MKAICKISHEHTFPGGGFKRYEAGQTYEGDSFDPALFEIIAADEPAQAESGHKIKGGKK